MALQSMGDKRKTQPDRVEVNLSKKVKSSEVRRPIIAPTSQFPPPPSPGHFPISAFPFSISPLSFALFVQIVCTPMSHRRMTNLTSAHSNPPPTTMDSVGDSFFGGWEIFQRNHLVLQHQRGRSHQILWWTRLWLAIILTKTPVFLDLYWLLFSSSPNRDAKFSHCAIDFLCNVACQWIHASSCFG